MSHHNTPASPAPRFNPWRIYSAAIVACAALAAGGYAVGVAPAVERAARAETDKAELANRRQHASELAATAASTRNELKSAQEALAALPLRLEPASQVNSRLAKITDLAGEVRLSVSEIRPGTVTEGRDFDAVPITIAGTGSYPACAALLHRLHEQFPDTTVRSFQTTQADGGNAAFSVDLVWHTSKRK